MSHQLHLLSANSWQVHCFVGDDAHAETTAPLRGPRSSEEGDTLSVPGRPESAAQPRELRARPEASEEEDSLDRGHFVSKAQGEYE